jgi:hypothetical protein
LAGFLEGADQILGAGSWTHAHLRVMDIEYQFQVDGLSESCWIWLTGS